MSTNGAIAEPIAADVLPPMIVQQILKSERQSWQAHRQRLLIQMDVQMTIARELKIDKADVIKGLEAQLGECVVAITTLDAQLGAPPADA